MNPKPKDFACPDCHAPAGFPCRSARGKALPTPHTRRLYAAQDAWAKREGKSVHATRTKRVTPVSKPGKHGTLYRYTIVYTDEGNRGFGEDMWNTWAYDQQHALDRFYESNADDSGWQPLRIARQQENMPVHRWTWHSLSAP